MPKTFYGPFTTAETELVLMGLTALEEDLYNEMCPEVKREDPLRYQMNCRSLVDIRALKHRITGRMEQ
jgi:hypothetical protein